MVPARVTVSNSSVHRGVLLEPGNSDNLNSFPTRLALILDPGNRGEFVETTTNGPSPARLGSSFQVSRRSAGPHGCLDIERRTVFVDDILGSGTVAPPHALVQQTTCTSGSSVSTTSSHTALMNAAN